MYDVKFTLAEFPTVAAVANFQVMRAFQLNEVRCDVTKGLPRSELAL